MGGTVTVVIRTALFTVMAAVVLRALVDTVTVTGVVISVQTGVRSVTNIAGVMQNIPDINLPTCELVYVSA